MKRVLLLLLAMAAAPVVSHAQDTVMVFVGESSGPARRAVSLFNSSRTTRFFRSATIDRDERINGRVAILEGSLTISGAVRGDVIALNGNVVLRRGAEVQGDILVIGGNVRGLQNANVDGNVSAYTSRVFVVREGSRIRLSERRDRPTARRRPSFNRVNSGFDIVFGANTYNRVEGLPIHIGPRIRWPVGSFASLTLEGVAIIRTAGDFDETREDFGYRARAELSIHERTEVSIGARVYDFVAPIESWKLTNEEVGLGTFLWHRDYRDYFLRRGYAGYIRIQPDNDIVLSGEVARNEDESIAARDPWTLFRRNDIWRANPLIDEGTFTHVNARLEFGAPADGRYRRSDWYLSLEWERGMSDSVASVALPTSIRPALPSTDYTYDRAFIDLRRYERIGWSGLLALRAVGAGTFGNDPLPVQRRFSLGGPEPLPGFAFRQFSCNAPALDPSNPALCDRMLLFQAEYRGSLSFSTDWYDNNDRRRRRSRDAEVRDLFDWDDWFWFDGPEFVLFGDVGSAWIDEDGPGDFEADVGAGITVGDFGVYGAKALTESESLQVILRISRRF